ncbi:MAG: hypothetical protein M1816_007592 [Peltula sp. TS41687]|nr:MAG: hypothetical protein M1816_007592 [Peltula sp. TS41687]
MPASTFRLPHAVTVNLPADLSKDQLLSFSAFQRWISTLRHSLSLQTTTQNHPFKDAPYRLRTIDVQSVDFFGRGRLGFVKLKADIANDEGERLPGSVFLRGPSVAMMVVLQPEDVPEGSEADQYVILAQQPRVPAGSLSFTELPAGMIEDDGSFSGAAAREIQEETGLEIQESELVDLTGLALPSTEDSTGERLGTGVYASPGGSDEYLPIFLYQQRIPRDQLESWRGKLTGLRDHGEKITLSLSRLEDLWREGGRDGKALAAWALYDGLRREGRLPGKSSRAAS